MIEAQARKRAALYVALHSGVGGDVAFYAAACSGAASVLELGVGDARVLSRLAVPKRVGLDSDASMLELAAHSTAGAELDLVLGDMAGEAVDGVFDRVIIPYNGLLCLSPADKLRCLSLARRLLSSPGRLVFDLYFADELQEDAENVGEEPEADEEEFLVELGAGDGRYNVFERNLWWPSERRLEACYRFVSVSEPGEPELRLSIEHHYLLAQDLAPLLQKAGFTHHACKMFNSEHEQVGVTAW